MKMKLMTVRKIRHIFLGMLFMTVVYAAVVFCPRILFARDSFIRTYRFSVVVTLVLLSSIVLVK